MSNRSLVWLLGWLAVSGGSTAGVGLAQESVPRAEYRIGIEDVLEVNVWKNAEASRQVWVRPDGRVTLPMVGELSVEGLTTRELVALLTERFKEFYTDPVVTVSLTEINSFTVYLLGRVGTPGAMKLRSPKTFLQVLAMAGGFQEFADTGSVVVVRWEGAEEKRIPVDAKKMVAKGSEKDFFLKPGDVVIVP